MSRGDLVLYRNPTSVFEKAITWATHGIYYHVEIALDEIHTIGAHQNGIQFGSIPTHDPDKYTLVHLPPGANIEAGLVWAKQQLEKQYGWLDIVYQGIKFLAPNNPFQLTQKDHWDCSDFVTRYLMECNVHLSDEFLDPYQNTPNDIARALNVLAPRKGVAS